MTQYLSSSFSQPTSTKPITKELWEYRLGLITAEQYEVLTGHKPDEETD